MSGSSATLLDHLVDLDRRRLDVADQQRTQPRLLGEGRVGAEDPQVLALVEAHDDQVGVVGLDEEQRDVRFQVDVAESVGDLFDVGDAVQVDLGGGPAGRTADHGCSEVRHGECPQ